MDWMQQSDAACVARARGGDDDAFRVLVERHSRSVFRLAYRMTGSEEDAEDVVQETFLKAYRRLDQFESRAQFGSWLHRIGANCAYDLLRGRGRRGVTAEPEDPEHGSVVESLPAADPGPERIAFGGEVRGRLRAVMSRMSELERAAFALRHFEGFSTREIGASLGVDAPAVKQAVFRAVRKLRQGLAPHLREPASHLEGAR
jgi:RNA polymerase sigma-70 factor (ECF subfamily)